MNKIEWRDIPGYEGEYEVSSDGRIYSVPRTIQMRNGRIRPISGRILSPVKCGGGYLQVTLGGGKREYIHRIVATVFLGDFSSFLEVNHKDEDKQNNCVSNLEWITHCENLSYGTANERMKASMSRISKKIVATRDEKIHLRFNSINAAERAGFVRQCIVRCLRGEVKKHRGYIWKYASLQKEGEL